MTREEFVSHLNKDLIPISKQSNSDHNLMTECVYLADYVQLKQEYNILVEYINLMTGDSQEKIRGFVIDKWQRANSYWSRYNLDYVNANEEDIKKSCCFEFSEENKSLLDTINKIREEFFFLYKKEKFSDFSNDKEIKKSQDKQKKDVVEKNNLEAKYKKTIDEQNIMIEYYKNRYENCKSILDSLLELKIVTKQHLKSCKTILLPNELSNKISNLSSYIKQKWGLNI